MFVRNSWYLAAWSDELRETPLGLVLLCDPIVLFRSSDGAPIALEDRCVHRRVPLSMGTICDDRIQCTYHGFVYDRTGACVKIPGQSSIPAEAKIRSYPIVERHGCIFVWMGIPQKADDALIPKFETLRKPGYGVTKKHVRLETHYQLIIDNLLDLSHLAYLHASSVGQAELAELAKVNAETEGDIVRVSRWTLDVPAVRTYQQFGRYETNIDRWQISEFTPPCFFIIDNGAAATGTGAPEGKTGENRWGFSVCHGITPETDRTTHYFWALSHEFSDTEDRLQEFYRQNHEVVGEDISIFEAQQKYIDLDPTSKTVDFKYDAGPLKARMIMDRLISEEKARA